MSATLVAPALMLVVLGTVMAADVPSSARSREAVRRVAPALNGALDAQGLKLGAPIFIRIFKAPSELEVWVEAGHRFERIKVFIRLGRPWTGPC
jgi:murein L,D-transpeptidase YafK